MRLVAALQQQLSQQHSSLFTLGLVQVQVLLWMLLPQQMQAAAQQMLLGELLCSREGHGMMVILQLRCQVCPMLTIQRSQMWSCTGVFTAGQLECLLPSS